MGGWWVKGRTINKAYIEWSQANPLVHLVHILLMSICTVWLKTFQSYRYTPSLYLGLKNMSIFQTCMKSSSVLQICVSYKCKMDEQILIVPITSFHTSSYPCYHWCLFSSENQTALSSNYGMLQIQLFYTNPTILYSSFIDFTTYLYKCMECEKNILW